MENVLPVNSPQPSAPRSRACDQCNFRKMKCNRLHPCRGCSERGLVCSFIKVHKKKGPAGKRIRELVRQHSTPSALNIGEEKSDHPYFSTANLALEVTQAICGESAETMTRSIDQGSPVSATNARNAPPVLDFVNSTDPSPSGINLEHWGFDSNGVEWGLESPSLYNFDLPANPGNPVAQPPPSKFSAAADAWGSCWPEKVSESSLLPIIDMFLNRLHPTLPVFDRTYIRKNLLFQQHRRNPHFGAMILALCAFTLIQPIQAKESHLAASRVSQAKILIEEAVKMRTTADFGQSPSIETVLTSFFLFACQYGRGQHNAAWFRLHEAVALGKILGLHNPKSYDGHAREERRIHLRTYWLLCITERICALQYSHSISSKTSMKQSIGLMDGSFYPTRLGLHPPLTEFDPSDSASENGLHYMIELLDAVNEDILDCWRGCCGANEGVCHRLDRQRVITLHRAHKNLYEQMTQSVPNTRHPARNASWTHINTASMLGLQESQEADVLVTEQWLHNRFWQLSVTHNLLYAESAHDELRIGYALTTAQTTLDICKRLSLESMEVHGVGFVAKLYDIISSVARMLALCREIEPICSSVDCEEPLFCTDCQCQVVALPSPNDSHACLHEHKIPVARLRETLNQYLAIFALFRSGDHPFLGQYIDLISKTIKHTKTGSESVADTGWNF